MTLSTGVPIEAAVGDSEDSRRQIKVRYDSKEAVADRWVLAENGRDLIKPIFYKIQLRDFILAQTMRIEFKPLQGPLSVARFDLRGLGAHAKFLGQCKAR